MDDLFGDLVSVKSSAAAAAAEAAKSNANGGPSSDATGTASASKLEPEPSVTIAVSREEYEQILGTAVQSAVDTAFSKFAKSLRTVLEDMNKRIEAQEKAQEQIHAELQELLKAHGEALARQDQNNNTRFTSLDIAVREVERGVQALRDKHELHEAQALLAKFSGDASVADKKAPAAVPEQAAAPAPAAAATPAPVAAALVAAAPAAASPVIASAPAPVAAAPPAMPAVATAPYPAAQQPLPAPQPQVLHATAPASAPPPAAVYQPGYPPQQQQQQAPIPHAMHQQGPASEPQSHFGAPPAQLGYPSYRAPDGGMPGGPSPHQLPQASDPYHHMMPPPMQQPPQHPPQQQQQQPQQHMAPGYAPPHFQQQQPLQQQGSLQGSMPPPGMGPPSGPSMYPVARMPSYPSSLPAQRAPSYQEPMPSPAHSQGPPPQSKTTSRAVPLDQIITDITNMGFQRHQVMTLVNNMQKNGQAIDLNVIIDKLTRGDFR